MRLLATRRSASLAALFLVVYGGCNWMTAQRSDVGVWYFEWERRIPFWPLMIVPYLSIDAFFLGAPFLCRDREEFRVLTRRIVAAILSAGVGFTLVPLRFAFERPAVEGWLGLLFDGMAALDRPFNLFPSLHVTLAVILADTYSRHTAGLVRTAIGLWFALIGASTVLIYQHHAIDVASGLVLALAVCTVIRESGSADGSSRNIRIAVRYAIGSAVAAVLTMGVWPWGAFFIWPAVSLAIVSAAYLGVGPVVFGKTHGRIRFPARLLLWPYLLGQRASLAWYRRRCRAYSQVAPGVWIGRRLDQLEASDAVAAGVTAVLDLTAEHDEAYAFTRIAYKNVQTLDLTAPAADALHAAVRFVSEESRRGVVYVHCKIGYSRSAAAVGAWLLASGRARTTDEAIEIVRHARPGVVVRPEAEAAMRRFEATLTGRRASQDDRPSPVRGVVSAVAGAAARLMCGLPRRLDSASPGRPRIYFANHTSHLDFLAIWGSLPPAIRAETRPVAGRDYWDGDPVRRLIARLFRPVLVERCPGGTGRDATIAAARRSVQRAVEALNAGASLIVFPEGTRGSGASVAPFKSGLYHVCRMRPDVELVPVVLENMHRILPKGAAVPVPLSASITFGEPIRLRPGEEKDAFLNRARTALLVVTEPCPSLSNAILRAS